MGTRLVEIAVASGSLEDLRAILKEKEINNAWFDEIDNDLTLARVALDSALTENLTDALEEKFGGSEVFRVLLLPVEAVLPRPKEEDADRTEVEEREVIGLLLGRTVGREELYHDVNQSIKSWPIFIVMTVLSTVVAGLGLAKNDVAVVIGAMVIAPLLGPNMAMALATTLGDLKLGWRALRVGVIGIGLSVAIPAGLALIMEVDPAVEEIFRRTQISLMDVIIAIAAGMAGSLAFTSGVSAVLIGVMVAAALLPPAAACGLLAGSGEWRLASGAGLLLAVNVVSINLAAVVTFLIQGIRPNSWYRRDSTRRYSLIAVGMWIVVLAALIGLILIAKNEGFFDVELSELEG